MKSLKDLLNEAVDPLPYHAHVSTAIDDAFDYHKEQNPNDIIRDESPSRTSGSKHTVSHEVGRALRTKAGGWGTAMKELHDDFGGEYNPAGGFLRIKTKEGIVHDLRVTHGTHHSVVTYSRIKDGKRIG